MRRYYVHHRSQVTDFYGNPRGDILERRHVGEDVHGRPEFWVKVRIGGHVYVSHYSHSDYRLHTLRPSDEIVTS